MSTLDGDRWSGAENLQARTMEFGLRVVRLYRALPQTGEARVIGNQLLRAGTAVGANYRAVCRARSTAEFIAKIGIVVEEADESDYWLEMLARAEIMSEKSLASLRVESAELLAIFAASYATARRRYKNRKRKQ